MIFKGTERFQFLEAVVTSTAKESLRSTEHGSQQVLAVLKENMIHLRRIITCYLKTRDIYIFIT